MATVERVEISEDSINHCPVCGGTDISVGPWQTICDSEVLFIDCKCGARVLVEAQPPRCKICDEIIFNTGEDVPGCDVDLCEDCYDDTQGTGLPSMVSQ